MYVGAVRLCLLTVHACSLARTGRRRDCAVFSSCEGDRGESQECSSVVIVLFTCQYAVYRPFSGGVAVA